MVDLHTLDQQADQVTTLVPVESFELVADMTSKVLQPSDQERQGGFQGSPIEQGSAAFLQTTEALAEPDKARFELSLVDDPFGIAVDQALDAALQLGHLSFQSGQIDLLGAAIPHLVEAALIFGGQAVRFDALRAG